jgi:hypothetical protein
MKGAGKTFKARELLSAKQKQIILDPLAEHDGETIFNSTYDFFNAYPAIIACERYQVVIRAIDDLGDYTPYLFRLFSHLRGATILIDECDRYCGYGAKPRDFLALLNYQRHSGIDLFLVARRAAAVHRDATALLDDVYIFYSHEPRDIEYIADLCGEETAGRVPQLNFQRHEFIHYQFASGGKKDESLMAGDSGNDSD